MQHLFVCMPNSHRKFPKVAQPILAIQKSQFTSTTDTHTGRCSVSYTRPKDDVEDGIKSIGIGQPVSINRRVKLLGADNPAANPSSRLEIYHLSDQA
jgi:hypothetical protein